MTSYKHIDHLCVLVHGLWGNPPHLNYLKHTLQDHNPEGNVHILVAKHNADYFTYDGIEVGAERVTHEIEETISTLISKGAKLSKISVVGYSLGGVIARYAIGLLYKDGVFERLRPVNFTTFASLWIGVRSPKGGFGGAFWNTVAPRTLSVTGRQMFVSDSFRDTGRPLLAVMADPSSIFMKALKSFKNKSLYANTQNDRSVPYYTAAFTTTNPFADLDTVEVNYLPGQDEKVLLDPQNPVSYKPRTQSSMSGEQIRLRMQRLVKTLPMYALFAVLFPIGGSFMILNGAYQSYKSAARIRLHESGQTNVDASKYRIAFFEETQAIQDQAMERLATAHSETPIKNEQAVAGAGFPPLNLNAVQLEMIKNLDTAGVTKYAAHIRKARHTHAAIIVRYESESFSEGVEVVRHWARNFET